MSRAEASRGAPVWLVAVALLIGIAGVSWSLFSVSNVETSSISLAAKTRETTAPHLLAQTGPHVCANPSGCIVIIGGGLAGMSAAVEAADHIIAHATAHPTPANSGLLTGSISAADSGLPSIIILESEPVMGGNSAKASSGQSAVGTPAQLAYEASHAADGIRADSPALFIADTLKSCTSAADTVGVRSSALADASAEPWRRYLPADPASVTGFTPDSAPASMRALVDTLAADSAAAIAFLEQHGVVAMDRLTVLGGHSAARTHRPGPGPNGMTPPVGFAVTSGLRKTITTDPRYSALITVVTGAHVHGLYCAGDSTLRVAAWGSQYGTREYAPSPQPPARCDSVRGVWYHPPKDNVDHPERDLALMHASAVVIATGGFAASREHLARWNPALAKLNLPTTSGLAVGTGIDMAQTVGAALTGLSHVQVHPTSFFQPSIPTSTVNFLAPEALRGAGGLLFDISTGSRFVDELQTRDHVSSKIYARKSNFAGLVLSPAAAADFGVGPLRFYASKGLVTFVPAPPAAAAAAPAADSDADAAAVTAAATGSQAAWADIAKDCSDSTSTPAALAAHWAFLVKSDSAPATAAAVFCKARRAASSKDFFGVLENGNRTQWLEAAAQLHGELTRYSATAAAAAASAAAAAAIGGAPPALIKDAFGKTVFRNGESFAPSSASASAGETPSSKAPEWVVGVVTPALHYTMGGIAIDVNGHALRAPASTSIAGAAAELEVMPGLFACGEASGGLHGRNRLGGNSLAECVVFGRRAGARVVADILKS